MSFLYEPKEDAMTILTLSKRDNAQGVRIPKDLREQMGMTDGCRIEASVHNSSIVLKPIHDAMRVIQVPRLSNVFKDRKTEYKATEDPFGAPSGDELL